MTIVADSSSMILLAKTNLLDKFLERNRVVISKKVYDEMVKGKEKGRTDAFLIERLLNEKNIAIQNAKEKTKNRIKKMLNLYGGENETLSLAIEHGYLILTDDKKCINASKALGLNFITTLDIVVTLHIKKRIDKKFAIQSLNELENYGWYKKGIIEKYRRLI